MMTIARVSTRRSMSYIFLFVSAFSAPMANAAAWEPEADEDGCSAEKRPVGNLLEVRVRCQVPVLPQQLADILWNVQALTKVSKDIKSVEVLKTTDSEKVVYERLHAPLISDRDLVYAWQRSGEEALQVFQFHAIPSAGGPPPNSDHVRMTDFRLSYTIEPEGRGSLMTYTTYADPAGNVPHWMARSAALKAALNWMRDLRTYLERVRK
jgi:hypothetical protein